MKKTMLSALLAFICLIGLTACSKKPADNTSETGSESLVQSSAQPEQSVIPETKPEENTGDKDISDELSVSDARRIVAEDIDTENYMILDGNTRLEIDGKGYYVFIVANKTDNTPVGQIAVDRKTGDKYNYKGEHTLEDYSEFKLYNPSTDMQAEWEGIFTDGTRSLELLPMDDKSFEYILDDESGVANATGNTAKDVARDVTFTYGEDGSITISGEITGVFTRS